MRINPNLAAAAIARYEKAYRQQKASQSAYQPEDKIEISERARIYTTLLSEFDHIDNCSEAKIQSVCERLANGTYSIDADRLAARMIEEVKKGSSC